ncbi:MAG: phytoene desaturase [Anaerolineae bacterium]|nr:phytoene desaturase [Anaerolineae bacterium]
MTRTAIIIGAGIGGIASAARLARAGYDVTVVEKNEKPGGRASTIEQDGFFFDTGPSLFLMPPTFAQTYADLGERMEDHLDLVRIDPTYRVHFHDGSILDLGSNLNALHQQLETFEPGTFEALMRFLAEGYKRYTKSLDKFVGRNFYNLFDFFTPANLPLLFQLKPLVKHYTDTSRYFKDARLRAGLSFQNMYLGLSPFDAPATYTLLQYTEMVEGVWYPRGGMYAIITSLTRIAEGLGAKFHYNAPVKQIDVDVDRAVGVTLENREKLKADVMVANADLPYVYTDLLPDPDGKSATKMDRLKYTSSTLLFYWGVKGERSEKLLHHNIFLSDHQYQSSFAQIFEAHTLPAEPSFYIHAPVRTVPNFAPKDSDALMVLVPTGHLDAAHQQDWPALQERARQWVFKRLAEIGLDDVKERIVFEATYTPPDYRRIWNLAKGATFGLSHNVMQVGYLRPQNRHSQYKNLYFAGASTHPGTGLPIVLLSAKLVQERILKEQPAP